MLNFLKSLLILVTLIFANLYVDRGYAGEPGELPEEFIEETETKEEEPIVEEKPIEPIVEEPVPEEPIAVEEPREVIEPDPEGKKIETKLPKNRLTTIFNQSFGQKIDTNIINIVGKCEPRFEKEDCKSVMPKRRSKHFNRYYFYLNEYDEVYAVVAFNDQRIGSFKYCKELLGDWQTYFNTHFIFEKLTSDEIEDYFILSDKPERQSIEIHGSCFHQQKRDIESYFYLSLYKQI